MNAPRPRARSAPRGAGSPPSARPRSRPTRSTRSPPPRAPRWPPPASCTAPPHALLLGFLAAQLRRLGHRAAPEPERELGAARTDRHEHQRALQGRARPRGAARLAARARAGWRLGRLRRHRDRQGGAVLRRRVRRRARQRLGLLRRRDRLPRRREPRRGRLRVRPRPADARVPRAAGTRPSTPTGSRREYLEDYYAVVEPDEVETIAFFADAIRDTAPQRADPVLRHRPDAAPRLPVRRPRVGDPPRRLPAAEPRRDRALARARAGRARLAAVRPLHAPVRGPRRPDRGAARASARS